MKTTWTTNSGKTVELETKVVGQTARDLIYTQYGMTIDGKTVKVIRQCVVKGKDCIEFIVPGNMQKLMLPIGQSVVEAVAAELKAVQDAITPTDVSLSEYDKHFEMMSRLMDDPNSDH